MNKIEKTKQFVFISNNGTKAVIELSKRQLNSMLKQFEKEKD